MLGAETYPHRKLGFFWIFADLRNRKPKLCFFWIFADLGSRKPS
jgi:hypothetical protein